MRDPKENLKKLIQFRESLGVQPFYDFSIKNKITPIEKIKAKLEEIEGITVTSDEVEKLLGGALLSYKGVLSVLYITDTNKTEEYLKNDELMRPGTRGRDRRMEEKSPKFHFTWCSTLATKKSDGTFDRYVMLRNKSGRFIVQAREDRYSDAYKLKDPVKLYACRHCLDGALGIKPDNKIGYHGFSVLKWDEKDKQEAVKNFNIQRYLEENESVLNDIKYSTKYDDRTAPENNYTSNWPEITRQVRENAGWACSECKVSLSGRRKLLHSHHKNGLRNDNSLENLVALCVLCHKAKPGHNDLPISSEDRNYILMQRKK